jgi:hypothetical protein
LAWWGSEASSTLGNAYAAREACLRVVKITRRKVKSVNRG